MTTIQFECLDLPGMLGDLAITAGSDKEPPDFQAACLHHSGGRLHGWSCDRYRTGHARAEMVGDPCPPFRVNRRACLDIAKTFRGHARVMVELELDQAGMACMMTVAAGVRIQLPVLAGSLGLGAKLGQIMPSELAQQPGVQGFQPRFIADFAAIAKRRKVPLGLSLNEPKKVAQVTAGPDYRGWVMPMMDYAPTWMEPVWE